MTSRAKEKVVSALNRLFRKESEKNERVEQGGNGSAQQQSASSSAAKAQGSPARRLLRHAGYHSGVTPSDEPVGPPQRSSGASIFKKKSQTSKDAGAAAMEVHQKTVRTRRLMKELQDIERSQRKDNPAFTVELINDNLYDWHVRLYGIDQESELANDMRLHDIKCISLQLTFPDNFPFVPPFMRVVSPRIEKGFVMEGGAICMELLTPRGWASAYTVEAIVMQFAASIVKGQGRISKKAKSSSKDFNRNSAEESFRSLVKTHDKYGWVTPPLADG
ncbi:Ubiquitin-conjugating enzyme [Nesidiocoris tenuis]|uniref:Ubiquitin-conjugating enzyme n=1 Tax=Nesidiocoris tenuis TaxID=355587 RepID=A0ABN7A8R0_9HEMI|nr:Ubiquitin-conjugating enzyme [Nesidiocoris tenuis]